MKLSLRGPLAVLFGLAATAALSLPGSALACACGCGVFGVSGSSLFASGSGGHAFVEYDYLDQNRNWSGTSRAPAADNDDKEIQTNFITLGGQYQFNRQWGVMIEVPYWDRTFKTDDGAGGVATFKHAAFGDVRLRGVYTGLSPDMSTGITFGVKLPTGDYKYANFDRDTEIGTGSTDLLIGAYHLDRLTSDNRFSYFVQIQWDKPVASQGGYKPGAEINGSLGVFYAGFTAGGGKLKITPVIQAIASQRNRDSGPEAVPDNTGYQRLLVAPGIEVASGAWKLYGDVEVPAYQHFGGNQLAAPEAFKLILSRTF